MRGLVFLCLNEASKSETQNKDAKTHKGKLVPVGHLHVFARLQAEANNPVHIKILDFLMCCFTSLKPEDHLFVEK